MIDFHISDLILLLQYEKPASAAGIFPEFRLIQTRGSQIDGRDA